MNEHENGLFPFLTQKRSEKFMQQLLMKPEESSAEKVIKRSVFVKTVPLLLLGVLLVTAFASAFVFADQYGITIDEPQENMYGQLVLNWYTTLGKDTSFMAVFPGSALQTHGAIFDVIIAEAQRVFGHPWQTRAVVNGLAAFVGVVAIALCGLELGGWWAAFLAALSLWLYPRFFGAMFNNSKDIPFTSATILILWAVLMLVRQWETKRKYLINSLLVGFLIGLADAVRIVALFWYVILGLLVVGWWIVYGQRIAKEQQVMVNLRKQVVVAMIIAVVSLITMYALWPYILLSPIHNLHKAITVMSKYPWTLAVPFAGRIYHANNLPRYYSPGWLVVGSPPTLVIFAAIGGLFACFTLIKSKIIDTKIVLICLALMLPLGALVYLRATLYDGMRQFLFLVPPLILLGVYGFMSLFTFLVRRRQTIAVVGLVVLALGAQFQVIHDLVALRPYEYMYFSPLVGGVPGATDKYDMDYWGVCEKPSAEWLVVSPDCF
jgi:4-amino-4-deoxy-L-arabinose transferase-like glycosyltransferase